MLEALAQVQNEDGTITFTQVPQYDSGDPNTINAVVKGLEENSPSLLSVAFYTQESAKYIDNRVNRINLIIDSKEDLTRALNAIKNNTHLTELTLCGYEITHKDYEALKADEPAKELVYALGNAVAKNPSLKTLRLYHAKLSGFLAYVLGCILEENTEISSLCLSESTLFDFGLEQIAEALKKNHFITQMDITNIKDPNNIGARIMPIFAGLAGGTGITRNATESLEKSLTRNREFAKRRAALEEKFWALVQKRVIPKSLVTTEKSIS